MRATVEATLTLLCCVLWCAERVTYIACTLYVCMYRVAHHVSDLCWVDFDFDVTLILTSCSAYSAYLSSAQAELGR